jgi:hypothetical protein
LTVIGGWGGVVGLMLQGFYVEILQPADFAGFRMTTFCIFSLGEPG